MRSSIWQLACATVLLTGGIGLADSVDVKASVTNSNFQNNSIGTGFRTSDALANFHSCSTSQDNGYGCQVSDKSTSTPKNIGNTLCLPTSMVFSIDQNCQSLLNAGAGEDCQENSSSGQCGTSQEVLPGCNWRTEETGTAKWDWTLTHGDNGIMMISCTNSGYQGYSQ
ncbi:MAG: hypothetical protein ACPGGK_01185 [Pikeienuella sp.]